MKMDKSMLKLEWHIVNKPRLSMNHSNSKTHQIDAFDVMEQITVMTQPPEDNRENTFQTTFSLSLRSLLRSSSNLRNCA